MPKYLIRVDDICESFNFKNFLKFKNIMLKFNIKPILAVVPNNKDKNLIFKKEITKPFFWKLIKNLQLKHKWTIGIHGYDHVYLSKNCGMMQINNASEFAGISKKRQKNKLIKSLNIFNKNNVNTDLFIAPAHSFDDTTLNILKELNINNISDGFFKYPGVDNKGIFWLPQQLWDFQKKRSGIWTVNFHINKWCDDDFDKLNNNLINFKSNIVDFNHIKIKYYNRKINHIDTIYNKFIINKYKFISFILIIRNFFKLS